MTEKCVVCGKPWIKHLGLTGLCRQLQEAHEKIHRLQEENEALRAKGTNGGRKRP